MSCFKPTSGVRILSAAAAVAALLTARPASSEEVVVENGALVVHVSPAGFDLSTAEGVEALRLKVRLAARAVCEADGGGEVMSRTELMRCAHDVYHSAQGPLETALAPSHAGVIAAR